MWDKCPDPNNLLVLLTMQCSSMASKLLEFYSLAEYFIRSLVIYRHETTSYQTTGGVPPPPLPIPPFSGAPAIGKHM